MGVYNKGTGKAFKWLQDHRSYSGDDCLIWPFARIRKWGYGQLGYNGRHMYAHRAMCELVHGPAPSDKHHATHECGKGHEGCVNPRHLSWKTVTGNLLDRRRHGTVGRPTDFARKLSAEQIKAARLLKGQMTQDEIATAFGVQRGTIQYWHRTDHDPVRPTNKPWRQSKEHETFVAQQRSRARDR